MNKGVRKVRQSIARRNKIRNLSKKSYISKQMISPFPQEEEKHGFYSIPHESTSERNQTSEFLGQLMLKGILSVVLFFIAAILLKTDIEILKKPKQWTSYMMKEEFPFARVNQWYKEAFGTPLAFSPQNNPSIKDSDEDSLPVIGNVTESFQANGSGIMIEPEGPSPVTAWRDGIIIFSGNDRQTNKTVIVQHADRSKTTYGLLSSVDVHLYQFVSQNQRIGTFNPTEENKSVFFSIEKNQKYIDPIQVIKVDDLP